MKAAGEGSPAVVALGVVGVGGGEVGVGGGVGCVEGAGWRAGMAAPEAGWSGGGWLNSLWESLKYWTVCRKLLAMMSNDNVERWLFISCSAYILCRSSELISRHRLFCHSTCETLACCDRVLSLSSTCEELMWCIQMRHCTPCWVIWSAK